MFIDLNAFQKNLTYLKGKIIVEPKNTADNTNKDYVEIEFNSKK